MMQQISAININESIISDIFGLFNDTLRNQAAQLIYIAHITCSIINKGVRIYSLVVVAFTLSKIEVPRYVRNFKSGSMTKITK